MVQNYLKIGNTLQKGRGVFSLQKIPADVLIEESPVIVLSAEDRKVMDKTGLHDYLFEWQDGQCCVALGYLSIYNHSYESNCEYFMDFELQNMQIKTVRPIEAGEELTINYNGDWNNPKRVWFKTLE